MKSSTVQYKVLITDLFILAIPELYVSFDASNRIPFSLNDREFTHSFHKQLLVVLTIKCHSQCIFATAEEKNIPGSDLLGTTRKDTMTGKSVLASKKIVTWSFYSPFDQNFQVSSRSCEVEQNSLQGDP